MIGWSQSGADLLDVLGLEPIEQDLYRANLVFAEEHSLYGGQVAAQALRAAGLTVDPERHVHSLHGYFLRKGDSQIPTVYQARATVPLGDDPPVHACALAYLSDILTGVLPAEDGSAAPGPSLDHAIWFHGSVDMNDWTLSDYHPRVSGHGRGWYTGSIVNSGGTLVASIAQETLFR